MSRAKELIEDETKNTVSGEPSIQYFCWAEGMYEPSQLAYPGSDAWIPVWTTIASTLDPFQPMVIRMVREDSKESGDTLFARDPRSILGRTVQLALDQGFQFEVGFEIEFHILDDEADPTGSAPNGVYIAAATSDKRYPIVNNTVYMLEDAGIKVWNYHPEAARGEYEIALSHCDPLSAVDHLLYAWDVVKHQAAKSGMRATMHPEREETGPTLGNHIHLGFKTNVRADAFLAGVVLHLPGITAVLNGGYDSYGSRTSRKFVGWADTKVTRGGLSSCVRRISPHHLEIRTPDCGVRSQLAPDELCLLENCMPTRFSDMTRNLTGPVKEAASTKMPLRHHETRIQMVS